MLFGVTHKIYREVYPMAEKTNIILVHGAWGDGGHWRNVIPTLLDRGHNVTAVQIPLTSLDEDVARVRQLADDQDGPTILVGHSYGGAVITGAGDSENVKGLVYIAAFAPDEGESLGQLLGEGEEGEGAGGSAIAPDDHGYLWIDKDKFQWAFAEDVDDEDARVMAVTQKPIAGAIFETGMTNPAWKNKPVWYQVSSNDRMIPPSVERMMAKRMNPVKAIELEASHASLASQPYKVAELILDAAESL